MEILVTGAGGFIGRNLTAQLRNLGYAAILEYDIGAELNLLDSYAATCNFVFHLAGVNRPENPADFMAGNFGFTSTLLGMLKKHGNSAPVLTTSSIQAEKDNPYGKSKKAGESLLFSYSEETGAPVFVYRLPNVFGKWCRPNYNSAVATFCYNISHDLPITVNDPSTQMQLVYIDDVVSELIRAMEGNANRQDGFCKVEPVYAVQLSKVADLIESFHDSRANLSIPDMSDAFTKKLYSTYLSYLPTTDFAYPINMNCDDRGSFTEFIRTPERGQISVNISKAGIAKGNHWHHTKNEKFLVVSGEGIIRFRAPDSEHIIEYHVNGEELRVVDIPPGYTHNIENIGDRDMVTIMWVNECFDPENPDTYALEV